MSEEMSPSDLILRASIMMQKTLAFYWYIFMHYQLVEDKVNTKTAAINIGEKKIYYNPDYIKKHSEPVNDNGTIRWNTAKVEGVIAHEILHALTHTSERFNAYFSLKYVIKDGKSAKEWLANPENKLKFERWNMASDIIINTLLTMDKIALPNDVLLPKVDYNGTYYFEYPKLRIENPHEMTTEELYGLLERNNVKPPDNKGGEHVFVFIGDGDGDGDGNGEKGTTIHGDGTSFTPMTESDMNSTEGEINKWINEAATHQRQYGKTPAGVECIIKKAAGYIVPWKDLLMQYVQALLPYDFSYSQPNKRYRKQRIYMPSVKRESLDIIIGIDTSGSVYTEVSDFLMTIKSITESFQNVRMTLIDCDTQVYNPIEVTSYNIDYIMKEWKPQGGGGTDFRPFFVWIDKNKPNAQLVAILTDGYGSFPTSSPNYHTLWIATPQALPERDFPFGKVVRMKPR